MATPREERIAGNEAMFRYANERAKGWEEHHADEGKELYFCECADPDCRQRLDLAKDSYEAVRSNSRRFLIAVGHEVPDVETVIETHDEWAVIEKDPGVTQTVKELDPRR
jgi:hypothetical protein